MSLLKKHTCRIRLFAAFLLGTTVVAQSAELITNGDFSSGFTGFSSGYSFVPSGTSNSNQTFGIRVSSKTFNSAYDVFVDHTSGDGNMMLIDGSTDPTVAVWQTTVSVVAGTDYTFSAWGTVADAFDPATLRFSINSTQIGADFPLVTPAGSWQNFTTVWNAGAGTTATIKIVDLTTGGFGNDFALDDISFTGQAIPEPSTYAVYGVIAMSVLVYHRKRNIRLP